MKYLTPVNNNDSPCAGKERDGAPPGCRRGGGIGLRHNLDRHWMSATESHNSGADGDGRRILLAEDDAPNAFVTATFLNLLGYQVDVAKDGSEALACFEGAHYDAVLLDMRMPVLDGLEVARRIRALEGARLLGHTRIIALTGNTASDEAASCRASGMDDFLAKPFALEQLAGKLPPPPPV